MITMALCGAGVVAGLWIVLVALFPRPGPLAGELARLGAPPRHTARRGGLGGLAERAGAGLATRALSWGMVPRSLIGDLELVEMAPEVAGAQLLGATVAMAGAGAGALVLLGIAGVRLGPAIDAAVLAASAAGAALVVLSGLAATAGRRRERFRRIFAIWLEAVSLAHAGGSGLEEAMARACELGEDWVLRRLASALVGAEARGVGPWEALASLGEELGVDEVVRAGASLALAGREGAAVRSSLGATAAGLRARMLAEEEARTNAVTERLFLPALMIAMGFLLFALYPGLQRVLGGLG